MRIRLENHFSLWLARPLDAEAGEWLDDSSPTDAQWFGGALVIEPRYVPSFADVASVAGAEVEVA
jgi:hypothetical protein